MTYYSLTNNKSVNDSKTFKYFYVAFLYFSLESLKFRSKMDLDAFITKFEKHRVLTAPLLIYAPSKYKNKLLKEIAIKFLNSMLKRKRRKNSQQLDSTFWSTFW